MDQIAQILPILLLVLVFYFLILRPARKRQKEVSKTQSELAVGSRLMLSSGIYGTVVALGDDDFDLEIAPTTTITVHRQAVARLIPVEVEDDLERPDEHV